MMWRILKKNLIFPTVYLTCMIVLLTVIQIAIGKTINIPLVLLSGIMPFFLILGVIFVNEQYEDKHHGYAFLDILPLKSEEIIIPKFILLLVSAAILVGTSFILLASTSAQPEQLVIARSYILLGASAALLFAGILYTSIFTIGYIKSIMIVLTLTTALGLVPMLVVNQQRDQKDAIIEGILSWLSQLNWIALLPLVVGLYLGLMLLSIHIKNKKTI